MVKVARGKSGEGCGNEMQTIRGRQFLKFESGPEAGALHTGRPGSGNSAEERHQQNGS